MKADTLRYVCDHCGARPPRGDYMVRDGIWANAGMQQRGFLCLGCLEKRLIAAGHGPLQLDDFIDAPCNAGIRFGYTLARREDGIRRDAVTLPGADGKWFQLTRLWNTLPERAATKCQCSTCYRDSLFVSATVVRIEVSTRATEASDSR